MNVSRRSVSPTNANQLGYGEAYSRSPGYGYESNVYQSEGDYSESNEDLRWVLYLTLIFGAMEVIIIYGKYDFLNVILYISS